MSSNITTPKLCKSSARWYVYYSENGKQKRFTGGINRIKNLKEREREAKILVQYLKDQIASGWLSGTQVTEANYTLIDALKFSLEKKKEHISKKTFHDYSNTLNFVIPAIKSIRLDHLYVKDTRRFHIKLILERMKKNRKWTNKSYNKNLNYLSAIFNALLQWDIIETNPCHKINDAFISN